MADFTPIDETEMRELYDNAPAGSHARDIWAELHRTETERARLQTLLDATIAGRNALRADLQTELMAVRKELDEARKPRFVQTIKQQREVDEQTRAFAAGIVADRKLTTLDEAKAFAQGWIETAVQEGRNAEYLMYERDKVAAQLQTLQALVDGAVV